MGFIYVFQIRFLITLALLACDTAFISSTEMRVLFLLSPQFKVVFFFTFTLFFLLQHLWFWPLSLSVSPTLWSISITLDLFPATSYLLPSPMALLPFEHSPLPLTTYPITLLFISYYPPFSSCFLCSSLSWESKPVRSICCAMFCVLTLSKPQQQCDNGHHTQPNSGLKEIYRAITRWLPHWRITAAKSTGLNTSSKSSTWLPSLWCVQYLWAWVCVCVCVWDRENGNEWFRNVCLLVQENLFVYIYGQSKTALLAWIEWIK